MSTGDHSLNITAVAQTLRAIVNEWKLPELRIFCKVKATVNKTKKAAYLMGKVLHQSYIRQKTDLQNI